MLTAQSLTARVDRDQLHIVSPRVHFLTGEALNRLRDGATVVYALQLTVRGERAGKALARTEERFAVSYDLWEEKFAITKLGQSPRSVSHLSAAAAEAWCVENTAIPIGVLPGDAAIAILGDTATHARLSAGARASAARLSVDAHVTALEQVFATAPHLA